MTAFGSSMLMGYNIAVLNSPTKVNQLHLLLSHWYGAPIGIKVMTFDLYIQHNYNLEIVTSYLDPVTFDLEVMTFDLKMTYDLR